MRIALVLFSLLWVVGASCQVQDPFSGVPNSVQNGLRNAIETTVELQRTRQMDRIYDRYLYAERNSRARFIAEGKKLRTLHTFKVVGIGLVPITGEWHALGCALFDDRWVPASVTAKQVDGRWLTSLVNLSPVDKGNPSRCAVDKLP